MRTVLKGEQLLEIARFLTEKGYDQGVSIEIEVENKAMLQKINDDFYYRYAGGEGEAPKDEIDDVQINIGGVKFRYFAKQD